MPQETSQIQANPDGWSQSEKIANDRALTMMEKEEVIKSVQEME